MLEIEPGKQGRSDGIASASAHWTLDNVLRPFFDAAVTEPVRTVGHYVNPGWNNKQAAALHPDQQAEQLSGFDSLTRTAARSAGSLVPYVIAGCLAERGIGALSRGFSAEGTVAEFLVKPALAQTIGATAYDSLRTPAGRETRTGNAASTALSFSIFGLGNELASFLPGPESLAVRLATGIAGGTGAAVVSQKLGSEGTIRWNDVATAGIGGAILNGLLPSGRRAAEQLSDEARMAASGRAGVSKYLNAFSVENAADSVHANRFIGRMAATDPRLTLPESKLQGHPISALPFRGAEETPSIDITDFNREQRNYLFLKLESEAARPMANPSTLKSLASALHDGAKDWRQQNLTQLDADFVQTATEEQAMAQDSGGKITEELQSLRTKREQQSKQIESIYRNRAQSLQTQLNTWAEAQNKPEVIVELADTPGLISSYSPGKGKLLVSTQALSHDELTPQVVEAVAHEYTHGLQDLEQIHAIADDMGIGSTATAEEKTKLAGEYRKIFDADADAKVIDQVLEKRNGKQLTQIERQHADAIRQSRVEYLQNSPLKSYPILNATLSYFEHVSGAMNELKDRQELQGALPEFSSVFGRLSKQIPSSLTQLDNVKAKLGTTAEDLASPGAVNDPGAVPRLQSSVSEMVKELRSLRESAYRSYLPYRFEREAHSTGYLASLYYRALAATNPHP